MVRPRRAPRAGITSTFSIPRATARPHPRPSSTTARRPRHGTPPDVHLHHMSAAAVARLSSPGEILAVLPSLCGFRPQESLVLMSLRGQRQRLGLTARVDLPDEGAEA